MGIRIGTGLGPLSVSARIDGGGGGGGGGDGDVWLAFFIGVLVLGGPIIWFLERDWKNIFLWWIFLHAFPAIALFGGLFMLFKSLKNQLTTEHFFFSLVGSVIFLVSLHKIPLAVNGWGKEFGCERCGSNPNVYEEVRKVDFTAPAYFWLLALGGTILLSTVLFLVSTRLMKLKLAQDNESAKAALIERQALQATKTKALRAKHADTLNAKQKSTKEQKAKLEESLTRLADITDKALSQTLGSETATGIHDDKYPKSLEASLRESFTDVRDCLFACQGVLTLSEIKQYQNELLKHRREIEDNFGFKDL